MLDFKVKFNEYSNIIFKKQFLLLSYQTLVFPETLERRVWCESLSIYTDD